MIECLLDTDTFVFVSRGQFTFRCTFTLSQPTLNMFITQPTLSY